MKPRGDCAPSGGAGKDRRMDMKHLYRLFMLFMALLLVAGIYLAVAGAREHKNRPLVPRGRGIVASEIWLAPSYHSGAAEGTRDVPSV